MTTEPLTFCPARHCHALLSPGRAFCPDHWAKLPKAIQHAVADAWGTAGFSAAVALARINLARREFGDGCEDPGVRVAICDEPWED